MNNKNQLITQIAGLVAALLAWINPDTQLSSGVQAAVIAIAGAVTAIVHVVAVWEKRSNSGGTTTPNPPTSGNPGNGTRTTVGS